MSGGRRLVLIRRAVALVVITAVVLAVAVAWMLWQPFAGKGAGSVHLVVKRGASFGAIADELDRRGVISHSRLFQIRAKLAGKRDDVQAGSFKLRRKMSYSAALDTLTAEPEHRVLVVTIPEGLSRAEVARVARRAGVGGDYRAASARSSLLDPRRYGAKSPRGLEGFLFPATYELKRGADARALVRKQVEAFLSKIGEVPMGPARAKNLNVYDVLTIAAMVEREVQIPRERRLVAAVIYNRLKAGQPLGIDATVRYATGNWTRPLRQSELASDSPYNTRRRAGLPPGPIGSPGLEAIRAAARPARVGYLYYVVKPGTCGEHTFAGTEAGFQRAVERYNAARERAGGRSPTDC